MACGTVYFGSKFGKAMEKGSVRYALGGACCIPNGGDGVWVAATDSRILAVRLEDGQCDEQVIIPYDLMPTKPAEFGNPVEVDGEKIIRTDKAKNGKVTQRIGEPIDGRFPNVSQVLHKIDTDYLRISIDPQLLSNLAEALGQHDRDEQAVELFIKPPKMSEHGALIPEHCGEQIAVKRGQRVGLIMPLAPGPEHKESVNDYNEMVGRFLRCWDLENGKESEALEDHDEEPETEEPVEDDLPVEIVEVETEAVTEAPDPETTEGGRDDAGDFEAPEYVDDDEEFEDEEDAVLTAEDLLAMLT